VFNQEPKFVIGSFDFTLQLELSAQLMQKAKQTVEVACRLSTFWPPIGPTIYKISFAGFFFQR
jgi:hypothetical protein